MYSALKFLGLLSVTQVLCMNPNILRTNSPARMNENPVFSTQMKEKDIFNTLDRLENFYEHKRNVPKINTRPDFGITSGARNKTFLRYGNREDSRKFEANRNRNVHGSLRYGPRLPVLYRKLHSNEIDAKNLLRLLRTDQILDLLRKLSNSSHTALRSDGLKIIRPRKGHAGVHLSESERSIERVDLKAPGKIHYGESSEETDLEVLKYGVYKKPWPQYSFYDFWTYKKPYIEGECRSEEVKVNGVCIQLPPH